MDTTFQVFLITFILHIVLCRMQKHEFQTEILLQLEIICEQFNIYVYFWWNTLIGGIIKTDFLKAFVICTGSIFYMNFFCAKKWVNSEKMQVFSFTKRAAVINKSHVFCTFCHFALKQLKTLSNQNFLRRRTAACLPLLKLCIQIESSSEARWSCFVCSDNILHLAGFPQHTAVLYELRYFGCFVSH